MRKHKRILAVAAVLAVIACAYLGAQLYAVPTQGQRVAAHALEHLDAPYVFHKSGPDQFDCSGLMLHCFADEGIELPHAAAEIGTDEAYPLITDLKKLRVGDVVCFDTVDDKDPSDHVGIYLGRNKFVHASSVFEKVVVSEIEGDYLETFTGARRIADVKLSISERVKLYIESFKPSAEPAQEAEA